MIDTLNNVESYLAAVSHITERDRPDWAYSSMEDLLYQRGHRFSGERDDTIKSMKARACFNNAFSLHQQSGLHYCEGYANAVIPVHHAWCCDDDGKIYDPTWVSFDFLDGRYQYLGCVFDPVFVATMALMVGAPGIFYHDHRISERLVRGDFSLVGKFDAKNTDRNG